MIGLICFIEFDLLPADLAIWHLLLLKCTSHMLLYYLFLTITTYFCRILLFVDNLLDVILSRSWHQGFATIGRQTKQIKNTLLCFQNPTPLVRISQPSEHTNDEV